MSDERWLSSLIENVAKYSKTSRLDLITDRLFDEALVIQDHNRITSVPKDARKERPIAIEPDMNIMLQLGVDGFIRRRLRRWGVDLNDQTPNQVLAREGSIYTKGSDVPCTIDLQNASDTVSLRICKLLFPPAWWKYLCDIRSPKGVLPDGKLIRYSKLSSMGNGYTFAIESTIFAALVYGVCKTYLGYYPRSRIAVFGDDIVVPQQCYRPLVECYLPACGFSPNIAKSFGGNSVKESCGSDWIHGLNVRPVHLDSKPEKVTDLFKDRNRLNRWLELHHWSNLCPILDALYMKWVPEAFRGITGPYSDECYDLWWHSPTPPSLKKPDGFYRHWSFRAKMPQVSVSEHEFRKLMARLTELPPPNKYSLVQKIRSSGSVFSVYDSNRIRYSVTAVRTSHWCCTYSP